MKISKLKELIKLLEESQISEIEISRFGTRVRISKGNPSSVNPVLTDKPPVILEPPPPLVEKEEEKPETKRGETPNLIAIKSPMVGTFYRAPAPDAPPYVEQGDLVKVGQTVCIIEAMKLMNEIESEVTGRIAEILVENGQPVEFGQELFLIQPQS